MSRPLRLLLCAGALALLGAACSDEEPPGYDAAFRADFEAACLEGVGGEGGADACACWYERVSGEVAFEDLPPLDELTAPAADEEDVDPDLYGQLAACVRAFGAVTTVPATAPPPPTYPPPATTTTTIPVG